MASNFEETFKKWERRVEAKGKKCDEAAIVTSVAQEILVDAHNAISCRAIERDIDIERSMKRAVAIFNAFSGRSLTETEGWMFMVCLKMARAKAGKFQRDDYIDMASYAALAGECDAKSV